MMLEKYRRTMADDVLHVWASDAQRKIDLLSTVLTDLLNTLEPDYSKSLEGADFLENARKDLDT